MRLSAFCYARCAHLHTKLNISSKKETAQKADAMGHEKFDANINPTSDGFENFYDSLVDTARHDVSAKLSVGFQLLVEVELYLHQS